VKAILASQIQRRRPALTRKIEFAAAGSVQAIKDLVLSELAKRATETLKPGPDDFHTFTTRGVVSDDPAPHCHSEQIVALADRVAAKPSLSRHGPCRGRCFPQDLRSTRRTPIDRIQQIIRCE
jgi:hypothetical protein